MNKDIELMTFLDFSKKKIDYKERIEHLSNEMQRINYEMKKLLADADYFININKLDMEIIIGHRTAAEGKTIPCLYWRFTEIKRDYTPKNRPSNSFSYPIKVASFAAYANKNTEESDKLFSYLAEQSEDFHKQFNIFEKKRLHLNFAMSEAHRMRVFLTNQMDFNYTEDFPRGIYASS